ncbi:signal transduction histidine kinase [Jimgerdemannia flammicorona]|uniref:Signal transduction histidine kinase n=1 Tax=Jimgerdemannia flammicorona TaxID=994334 RepID=A0A433QGY7_9FUNG|nr:signal transduction histidine kinase [Jimgerdemannia flammicorona]
MLLPPHTHENNAKDSEKEQEGCGLGLVDHAVFDQLTDMDNEDDHEFSKSIAETTFEQMDVALDAKDLSELSRLGHFLKGSSAFMGLRKVTATCEKIQYVGNRRDGEGNANVEDKA